MEGDNLTYILLAIATLTYLLRWLKPPMSSVSRLPGGVQPHVMKFTFVSYPSPIYPPSRPLPHYGRTMAASGMTFDIGA